MNKITRFTGRYRFLSNFWRCDIMLDGVIYPSVEHAYQAAKTVNLEERRKIRDCDSPGDAKRLGRTVSIRRDWDYIRLSVMRELLTYKFKHHPTLAEALKSTGDAELIEGNTWGDTYWGVCNGKGDNNLGKLLMEIRAELEQGEVG